MAGKNRSASNSLVIKAQNMRVLLLALLRQQPISRIRLARATNLSTTTVTTLVAELLEQGVICEAGTDLEAATAGAGRPPLALRLRPESRCALGIHIGVRRVRVALVDLQANILDHEVYDITPDEPAEHAIARAGDLGAAILARHHALSQQGALVGIGVGASGLVENQSGTNILAPNLGWRNVPLRRILSERFVLPVVVDNNVRCMALAESLYGVGRNARALAYVYARIGVGAGIVVDGEIYRGADYGAGEIGHWVMTPNSGDLCRCGNRGCLETLISESVLMERAHAIDPELITDRPNALAMVFAAARDGHLSLVEMLEERAYYVGIALANLVNVINPQLIMLGGWLYDAFDLIEPVIERTMRRHAFGGLGNRVDILPTSFGAYSGVIGAGVLALENFFYTPGSAAAQRAGSKTGRMTQGTTP